MTVHAFSKLSDRAHFIERFSKLPEEVRSGPYRTGLLPAPVWSTFLCAPWNEPYEFWIVTEGRKTLSRLGAKVSAHDPRVGFIGFLEFDPADEAGEAAASQLIASALRFLRECRVERIYAPVQMNTWFPYRYRVSEEDRRYFSWEPVNPPAYLRAFEAAGFVDDMTYHSTAYGELEGFLEKMRPAYTAALSAGCRFRSFDRSKWLEHEVPVLHRLSHDAFSDNYLFEPISLDLFTSLYVHIADKAHQFSKKAVAPDGREVGFLFGFMDRHREKGSMQEERYFVIKSLAVVPDARGRGLSNALVYAAVAEAVEAGAEYAVSALVRSGIQSESYEKKGRYFWQHRYSLLRLEE